MGVSPDDPADNARFREMQDLDFPLLSDVDHVLAGTLGAWGPRKIAGHEYEGLIRSTFVVEADGSVSAEYRDVRVKGHAQTVLEALTGR